MCIRAAYIISQTLTRLLRQYFVCPCLVAHQAHSSSIYGLFEMLNNNES